MRAFFAILLIFVAQQVRANPSCGDDEKNVCECATMLRSVEDPMQPNLNTMMYYLKISNLKRCDEAGERACRAQCVKGIDQTTYWGDLNHRNPRGRTPLQMGCLILRDDVVNGQNYLYTRVCGKEWKPGKLIYDKMCCYRHIPCAH